MADGRYANGDPHTFAEGRRCATCDTPLPDQTGRFGTFSKRCASCRTATGDVKPRKPRLTIGERQARLAQRTPSERTRSAQVWKKTLVSMVGAGSSIVAALTHLDVSGAAYDRQRARDATFRAEIDSAKLRGRALNAVPDNERVGFGDFAARYFGRTHYLHQLRIINEIESLDARDVVMILLWPEAGKTATIEDYICKTLAEDPTHRFRVVSEAADLATRIVGACGRRFRETEMYPDFIARYGPFYEKGQERSFAKPWTSSQITLWGNPGTERDRNLVAQSWSGQNYGSRIDTLILDDLISQRNVNQSQEIFERIRGTFFNRGVAMKTIIVGTRIKPGDLYDKFDDAGLITRHLYLPAVGSLGAEPGMPTTPEMWEHRLKHSGTACCPPGLGRECPKNGEWLTPKEYLDLIRFQSGEETWWASYMQNPRDDAVSTFGDSVEDCKDRDRAYGPEDQATGINILAIDPALGGGTALVAANCGYEHLDVLDAYTVRGLARTEQQLELIEQYAKRYRPSLLIVEYDAQQKGLGNDERLRQMGRRLGFTITPHTTRGQKFDVPYAVASMNQSFVRREVSIPWGDEATRQRMEVLVHQLRGWRIPEHGKRDTQVQDLVMALWFIWRHWMQTRNVPDRKYTPARRPGWAGGMNLPRGNTPAPQGAGVRQ